MGTDKDFGLLEVADDSTIVKRVRKLIFPSITDLGDGVLEVAVEGFMGWTQSAVYPTTTQYPNHKNWGIHLDTSINKVYFVVNNGGAIRTVQLS